MDFEFLKAIRKVKEAVFGPVDEYPLSLLSQVSDEAKSEALTASLDRKNLNSFLILLNHHCKPREQDLLKAIRTNCFEVACEIIPHLEPVDLGQALLAALKFSANNVFEKLIEAGADVNIKKGSRPALCLALNLKNIMAVELLLEKEAKTDEIQVDSFSRLIHRNNKSFLLQVLSSQHLGALRGNGLESANQGLIAAAKCNDIDLTKALLEKGANVNYYIGNVGGYTPLMIAVKNNNLGLTKFLLSNGADPNMQLPKKHVALMWPAKKGHEAIAELLLANGANPEAKNYSEMTAFDSVYHSLHNSDRLREMFRQAEDDNMFDKVDLSYFTVAWRAKYNKSKWEKVHEEFEALKQEKAERLDQEMKKLFNGNMNSKDYYRRNMLMFCARFKYPNFVKYLIEKTASTLDVDEVDENGMTALIWAALSGAEESVKLLLEADASVDMTDWMGRTALHHAIRRRHEPTCRILIEAGSGVKTPEQLDGAMEWAQEKGYEHIKKILQAAPVEIPDGLKWTRRERSRKRRRSVLKASAHAKPEVAEKTRKVVVDSLPALEKNIEVNSKEKALEQMVEKAVAHDIDPCPNQ